jgi:hypothetical protein
VWAIRKYLVELLYRNRDNRNPVNESSSRRILAWKFCLMEGLHPHEPGRSIGQVCILSKSPVWQLCGFTDRVKKHPLASSTGG